MYGIDDDPDRIISADEKFEHDEDAPPGTYIDDFDLSDELFVSDPGPYYQYIDDCGRMITRFTRKDGTYSYTIDYTPPKEVWDYIESHFTDEIIEFDEDGFHKLDKGHFEMIERQFIDFKRGVDVIYKPSRIIKREFMFSAEYATDFQYHTSHFYLIPKLRVEAFNHLQKRFVKALHQHYDMMLWKRRLLYVYTKQKINNESRFKEFVKTIEGYNEENTKWLPKKKKEKIKPFEIHPTYKEKHYPMIYNHILADLDDYNEYNIYKYLDDRYFKLAVVFSNVPYDEIEDKNLKRVKFEVVDLDEIILPTVESNSIREILEKKNVTKIKAKRMWRDIHFENDKAYYNYGKGNKQKEYISYDDIEKLQFM